LIDAVKHGGLIPWDDDLDIGMLRVDYKKNLKMSKNEFRNNNFLQNWYAEPKFVEQKTKKV